jgi:hypothetical protein
MQRRHNANAMRIGLFISDESIKPCKGMKKPLISAIIDTISWKRNFFENISPKPLQAYGENHVPL